MSGGDHATPVPHLRGPHIKLLSGKGFAYFAARSAFRYFVTGREITGPGDNATFLHDATQDFRNRPVTKLSRARWQRVARRWAIVGIPGSLLTAEGVSDLVSLFPDHPEWADLPWDAMLHGYMVGGPLAAGAIFVPKVKAWHEMREPAREYIYPSVQVACKILGVPYRKRDALRMLDLPPGWGKGDESDELEQVMPRLYLPPVPLDAGTKKRIVTNVGARLGIPDPEGDWQEIGGRAHVTFRALALPAKQIPAGVVRAAIEAAPVHAPVVGFGQRNAPAAVDYLDESPHILVSGGSGTGKSTLLRALLSQRMSHGNGLIVLDYKRMSHPWADDMPSDRALYFYKIADIHDALVRINEELTARMHGPKDMIGKYRPVDICVEELNSLTDMLRAYWQELRAEIKRANREALKDDPDADVTEPPLRSPALQALALVTNLGRQVSMHLHVAGQRVSAPALGANGGDVRENFQSRLIAKWTRKTWKMLTDVPYIACPSGPRGLWALVQGDSVTIIRVPNMSDDEARTLALSGPCPSGPILSALDGHRTDSSRTLDGETVQPDRLASVRGQRVVLSDASGQLGLTLDALRVASKRDENFPEPVEVGGPGRPNRYDLAELIRWREQRDGVLLEVGSAA